MQVLSLLIDPARRSARVMLWKVAFALVTIIVPLTSLAWLVSFAPFWSFTLMDVVDLFTPFLIIALVMERTVEVMMGAWRGRGKAELLEKQSKEAYAKGETVSPSNVTDYLRVYKAETRVLSLLLLLLLGVIASLLGFRILQPLVDPAVFSNLPRGQVRLFAVFDIFITGAMLGGGSEGIHKIVDTILSFVEKKRRRLKESLLE